MNCIMILNHFFQLADEFFMYEENRERFSFVEFIMLYPAWSQVIPGHQISFWNTSKRPNPVVCYKVDFFLRSANEGKYDLSCSHEFRQSAITARTPQRGKQIISPDEDTLLSFLSASKQQKCLNICDGLNMSLLKSIKAITQDKRGIIQWLHRHFTGTL